MTSGLAHEIKNPLSTIALNAQLLGETLEETPSRDRLDDHDRQRLVRRTGTIVRETERLRGILTDFLDFAGEKRVQPVPRDLSTLVDELVDFFLPQAEVQRVRLRADLHPEPLRAPLDGPMVKQALLNLMLNALQSMEGQDRPAELILRTRPGRTAEGSDAIVAHVIDTGPGIPPETQERMFSPYFTTKASGTGLGLPTTRRIVQEHGGEIRVHSSTGTGTDFELVFPVRGERASE